MVNSSTEQFHKMKLTIYILFILIYYTLGQCTNNPTCNSCIASNNCSKIYFLKIEWCVLTNSCTSSTSACLSANIYDTSPTTTASINSNTSCYTEIYTTNSCPQYNVIFLILKKRFKFYKIFPQQLLQ